MDKLLILKLIWLFCGPIIIHVNLSESAISLKQNEMLTDGLTVLSDGESQETTLVPQINDLVTSATNTTDKISTLYNETVTESNHSNKNADKGKNNDNKITPSNNATVLNMQFNRDAENVSQTEKIINYLNSTLLEQNPHILNDTQFLPNTTASNTTFVGKFQNNAIIDKQSTLSPYLKRSGSSISSERKLNHSFDGITVSSLLNKNYLSTPLDVKLSNEESIATKSGTKNIFSLSSNKKFYAEKFTEKPVSSDVFEDKKSVKAEGHLESFQLVKPKNSAITSNDKNSIIVPNDDVNKEETNGFVNHQDSTKRDENEDVGYDDEDINFDEKLDRPIYGKNIDANDEAKAEVAEGSNERHYKNEIKGKEENDQKYDFLQKIDNTAGRNNNYDDGWSDSNEEDTLQNSRLKIPEDTVNYDLGNDFFKSAIKKRPYDDESDTKFYDDTSFNGVPPPPPPPPGSFISYFIIITACVVTAYVLHHNRAKIIALAVEGWRGHRRRRSGSRSSVDYKLLMPSNHDHEFSSQTRSQNVIY